MQNTEDCSRYLKELDLYTAEPSTGRVQTHVCDEVWEKGNWKTHAFDYND
jgi:hypothetical protein